MLAGACFSCVSRLHGNHRRRRLRCRNELQYACSSVACEEETCAWSTKGAGGGHASASGNFSLPRALVRSLAFRLDVPTHSCRTHTTRVQNSSESILTVRFSHPFLRSFRIRGLVCVSQKSLWFLSLSFLWSVRHNFCILKRRSSFFVINPLNAEIGCSYYIAPRQIAPRNFNHSSPFARFFLCLFFVPSFYSFFLSFS